MSGVKDYDILNRQAGQYDILRDLVEYAWKRQNSIPKPDNPSFQENFSGQYSSVAQVNDSAWILDGGHGGIHTWQSYVPVDRTIILMGGGVEINTVEAPFLDKYKLEHIVRELMELTEGMKFYIEGPQGVEEIALVENGTRLKGADRYYFKTGPYPAFTVPKDPTLASTTMYDKQQVAIYYEELYALGLKFKKVRKHPEHEDYTLRAHHWGSGYQLETTWKIHLVDLKDHLVAYRKNADKYKNYTKNP